MYVAIEGRSLSPNNTDRPRAWPELHSTMLAAPLRDLPRLHDLRRRSRVHHLALEFAVLALAASLVALPRTGSGNGDGDGPYPRS